MRVGLLRYVNSCGSVWLWHQEHHPAPMNTRVAFILPSLLASQPNLKNEVTPNRRQIAACFTALPSKAQRNSRRAHKPISEDLHSDKNAMC